MRQEGWTTCALVQSRLKVNGTGRVSQEGRGEKRTRGERSREETHLVAQNGPSRHDTVIPRGVEERNREKVRLLGCGRIGGGREFTSAEDRTNGRGDGVEDVGNVLAVRSNDALG